MRLSALDVKKKEFQQKMRGADPEEVQAFLDQVSLEIEELTRERMETEGKAGSIQEKLDHFLGLESTLEKTLVAAQQTALRMEDQAKREADLIRKEAELARDQMFAAIKIERERAEQDLMRVRSEYDSTIARIKALLNGFGSFLNSIETDDGTKQQSIESGIHLLAFKD